MEFHHHHLGTVQYSKDEVLSFPQGLLGYFKYKNYILASHKDFDPFKWMISIDNHEIGFPLVDPLLFCPDYSPNITKRDLNELSAENPQSLEMYSIVTMNHDPSLASANLSGPVLLNLRKKIGKQLVLLDDRYSTKHRILNK